MKDYLRKRIWLVGVLLWVILSNRIEPFKSHFGLALLGAFVVGVLIVGIEIGLAALMKMRTRP